MIRFRSRPAPDGNLWFINAGNNRGPAPATAASIGRITPAGVVSNFTSTGIQGMGQNEMSEEDITTGPDGNLWFTNVVTNSIGYFSP
jgi:streptogramin lyase